MAITSEIWQVGGDGFTSAQDAAIYLICFDGRAAIVDAGCGGHGDRLETNIRACDIEPGQVDYLLLTHCHYDHTGGAEDVRTRFECAIVAHDKDAEALESGNSPAHRRQLVWNHSAAHGGGYQTFRQPQSDRAGHQAGDRRSYPRPYTGVPWSIWLNRTASRCCLDRMCTVPCTMTSDPTGVAYQQSLLNMTEMAADILCEGHFGVFRGADRVRDFIRSFL